MSTPGSGAAEMHGLVPDGQGGWLTPPDDEPAPGEVPGRDSTWATDPLPAVAEGWTAGELPDPLDDAGNGTGPHEFQPAGREPEQVQGDPEQAMRAVAAEQPGTWPTSPLDLIAGPPETPADTASPTPGFEYGHVPDLSAEPADPPVPDAVVTAFRATVKIDPIADTGSFELSVAGSAALVSSIVEQFAQSFLFETQQRVER